MRHARMHINTLPLEAFIAVFQLYVQTAYQVRNALFTGTQLCELNGLIDCAIEIDNYQHKQRRECFYHPTAFSPPATRPSRAPSPCRSAVLCSDGVNIMEEGDITAGIFG